MEFPPARPDVVRAISQRWLLKFWRGHLGQHRVPCWQSVAADNLKPLSANLSLLDLAEAEEAEEKRFLIRFHGSAIAQIYGSSDCRGKFLDEVLPPADCASALKAYHRAVECGCPIYTIHDVSDRQGRIVHYERLMLPFARDGQTVDRVLASFELVCEDGGFDSTALLTSQAAPPVLKLAATIEPASLA